MSEPCRTILWQQHKTLGATFTEFGGWEMPLYYTSIRDEHLHTRAKVGVFDLCHMARFLIRGQGFRDFLHWLTPSSIISVPSGKVLYSFLLNERGGVKDDITIYVGDQYALIVGNAANREKDFHWLVDHVSEFPTVQVWDVSGHVGMLAVQGPLSDSLMKSALGAAFQSCPYYTFVPMEAGVLPEYMQVEVTPNELFGNAPGLIYSATGYTGENGYEIYAPNEIVLSLWERLLAAANELEVKPIGLGARDSLRLEACMPLYGHELAEEITPLEAGLARFIDFTKTTDFVGRLELEQIRTQGVARKLVGLEMTQRGPIPRQGCCVKSGSGEEVGVVTSGGYAPSLDRNVALAYVSPSHSHVGDELDVVIRDRTWPVAIVKRPFYRRSG
ncbi:MAG: glycine cleavage system aminomethyltransferase GcvT [Candidatus Sumerlaeaceae bacterium]|nr:glycine cleavage system aminomethyltransferase GcvT [Candidatus Sumerlaeaceae bacterium]